MDPYAVIFNKFYAKLPALVRWMNQTKSSFQPKAKQVAGLGFKKIDVVYPPNLRSFAKVVCGLPKLPFPPFKEMGLEELAGIELLNPLGITYNDMIYITGENIDEITCFHEMIHVVQWKHLGIEKFIIAYGVLQVLHGYRDNPFEQIAHHYQERLESNALPMNFLEKARQHATETWNSVNPLYRFSGGLEV